MSGDTTAIEILPPGAQSGPGSYGVLSSFHGKPQTRIIQAELPWHRKAAQLVASAQWSLKQIADLLDKSESQVQTLFRQPWFQKTVSDIMLEEGQDISEQFRAEALNSLNTLVEVRDDLDAGKSIRVAAAIAILDRAPNVGKPIQRIESKNINFSGDPVVEANRLRSEIKNLEKPTYP
jgi:hypothetical protein